MGGGVARAVGGVAISLRQVGDGQAIGVTLYGFVGEVSARRCPGYIVTDERAVHAILITNSGGRFGFGLTLFGFALLYGRSLLVGALLSVVLQLLQTALAILFGIALRQIHGVIIRDTGRREQQ
jgi:hypothetical protein